MDCHGAKRCVGVGIGALIPILALLLGSTLINRELVYQNKPVSQWVSELPGTQQPNPFGALNHETAARRALRNVGTNAIPYLIKAMLQADGSLFTELKFKIWYHSSFLQSHFVRPARALEIRREAASMLQEILSTGPGVLALDEIIQASSKLTQDRDPHLRVQAVSLLGLLAIRQHSDSALSALILGLESPDDRVRSAAAWKLSYGGTDQRRALAGLHRVLSDSNDAVRVNAALAVYRIAGQTNNAVSVLIEALNSPVSMDRGNAAYHLYLIGPPAKAAIPALKLQIKDKDEYARTCAREALGKIDPEAMTTAPDFSDRLLPRVEGLVGQGTRLD